MKEIKKRAKTFTPGQPLPAGGVPVGREATNASGLTPDQVKNIKEAIAKASTLEEIERLNQMLRTGMIPGDEKKKQQQQGNKGEKIKEETFFKCLFTG